MYRGCLKNISDELFNCNTHNDDIDDMFIRKMIMLDTVIVRKRYIYFTFKIYWIFQVMFPQLAEMFKNCRVKLYLRLFSFYYSILHVHALANLTGGYQIYKLILNLELF